MIIPSSPTLTVEEIENICEYGSDSIQIYQSSTIKRKVLMGSFALLIGLSSTHAAQAITHPSIVSEQEIIDLDSELDDFESYPCDINIIESNLVFKNSDLIDGDEIEAEIEFLNEYNVTMKSYYKNQKKPFVL